MRLSHSASLAHHGDGGNSPPLTTARAGANRKNSKNGRLMRRRRLAQAEPPSQRAGASCRDRLRSRITHLDGQRSTYAVAPSVRSFSPEGIHQR